MRAWVVLGVVLAACASDEGVVEVAPPAAPVVTAAPSTPTWQASSGAPSPVPRDLVELFGARILPTCALNGGVCHASKNYPELGSVAAIVDAVGAPCRSATGRGLAGCAQIVPGHPERSFLVARLWDAALDPELMPRQCRAWDDRATRALACWVSGLRGGASGAVENAYDPIDYAACTFRAGAGRCGSGTSADGVGPLFARACEGCHGGHDPTLGLDLSEAAFAASTVGVASRQRPGAVLVVPGDPRASWLYRKLTEDAPAIDGARMPKGAPLESAEVELVRTWIEGLPAR